GNPPGGGKAPAGIRRRAGWHSKTSRLLFEDEPAAFRRGAAALWGPSGLLSPEEPGSSWATSRLRMGKERVAQGRRAGSSWMTSGLLKGDASAPVRRDEGRAPLGGGGPRRRGAGRTGATRRLGRGKEL